MSTFAEKRAGMPKWPLPPEPDTSEEPAVAGWAEQAVRDAEALGHHTATREEDVLHRIERARALRPRIAEDRITLSHGAGGKASRTLTEALFLEAFHNPLLAQLEDGATFPVLGGRMALTTDSFVVSPIFFPGGDIGDLAVNGTVNDLAVTGARPLHLSAAFVLEEGFPIEDLRRVVASMRRAADVAGVDIVTGDTKVVPRGKADKVFITTAGVGVHERELVLSAGAARPGDAVIVSGDIGRHGITVMLARGDLDIEADVESDTASLAGLVDGLLSAVGDGVRCLRDATRGGVATVCNEIAGSSGVALVLDEQSVPVREDVTGACELLGIDPLYVACEGRLVAVVDGARAEQAVAAMRAHPVGEGAAVIGTVKDDPPGLVLLRTSFGGTRIVDLLVGDPLPRIC